MRYKNTRFFLVLVAIALITLVIFFRYKDVLATYTWDHYHNAPLALALDSNNAPLAFQIGNFYFNGGAYNLSLAQSAYERVISINPLYPVAHYQLARVLFVENDFSGALAAINKEILYYPQNERSLYVRALIYAYSGQFDTAAEDLKGFIQFAPTEWAGYNDLGWILGSEGKYAEGESILQQAFANVPNAKNNPWLWNTLGVMQLNRKEYTQAILSFQQASSVAASLTGTSWHTAYPGNDESQSTVGIIEFQSAIAANLTKAMSAQRSL